MKNLNHCNSIELAYLVEDYPAGFRKRCKIRYWVETREGYGQRVVSQTTKPGTDFWCKPKLGGYSAIAVLYLNEESGHVMWDALTAYTDEARINAFIEKYLLNQHVEDSYWPKMLKILRVRARASSKMTWSVKEDAAPTQTAAEQATIICNATARELAKMDKE